MRKRSVAIYTTGDQTSNIVTGFNAQVPSWARILRVQVCGTDFDTTFSARIHQSEEARDSAPHVVGGDNAVSGDWTKPHICVAVPRGVVDFEIFITIDVTTGATCLTHLQWED